MQQQRLRRQRQPQPVDRQVCERCAAAAVAASEAAGCPVRGACDGRAQRRGQARSHAHLLRRECAETGEKLQQAARQLVGVARAAASRRPSDGCRLSGGVDSESLSVHRRCGPARRASTWHSVACRRACRGGCIVGVRPLGRGMAACPAHRLVHIQMLGESPARAAHCSAAAAARRSVVACRRRRLRGCTLNSRLHGHCKLLRAAAATTQPASARLNSPGSCRSCAHASAANTRAAAAAALASTPLPAPDAVRPDCGAPAAGAAVRHAAMPRARPEGVRRTACADEKRSAAPSARGWSAPMAACSRPVAASGCSTNRPGSQPHRPREGDIDRG
eukprot:8354-Chlamydomonas_euryale.AAC.2